MNALKNFFVFLISLLFTVLLADIGLQAALKIPSQYLKKMVSVDTSKSPSKRMRPNLDFTAVNDFREFSFRVTTDAYGFRKSPGLPAAAPKDTIVFVGDSQAFGVGPNDEDTFVYRTGLDLKRPVINAAVPGASNMDELEMARFVLTKIPSFKTLILCFSNGTDPYENIKALQTRKNAAPAARAAAGGGAWKARFKDFLVRRSALYQLLIRLRKYPAFNRFFHRLGLVESGAPPELKTFFKMDEPAAAAYWQATDKILLEILELCREHGMAFMILVLPDRYQVDSVYWKAWVRKYQLAESQYDLDAPNQHLEAFCRRHGLSFIDPTPELRRSYQQGISGYWKMDLHLSPVGHALVHEVLVREISGKQEAPSGSGSFLK